MKNSKAVEVIAGGIAALVILLALFLATGTQASAAPSNAPQFGYPDPESGTSEKERDEGGTTKVTNPDGNDTTVTFPSSEGHVKVDRAIGAKETDSPFGEPNFLYGVDIRWVDDDGNPILEPVTICFPYDGGSPHIYVLAYNPLHWVLAGGSISGDQICIVGLPGTYAVFD